MTYRTTLVLVAIAGLLPAIAFAQSAPARVPVTDMSTPARSTAGAAAAASTDSAALRKSMADLTLEIEQLRAEVRELRGQLEVQTHELDSLKNRNRDALADTDKRLRELERKAAPAPAAAPTAEVPAKAEAVVSADEQKEYDAAFGLMKQGQYDKAAKAYRTFLTKHPKSELAGNAQYWIGEAQYVVRNFKQAIVDFSVVVDKYPASLKLPDSLLKIGYSHAELGANDKARTALQQVVTRFPNTVTAKSAEKRLAELKAADARKAPDTKPKKP